MSKIKLDDIFGIYCPNCGSIIATSVLPNDMCPVCKIGLTKELQWELYFEDGVVCTEEYDGYEPIEFDDGEEDEDDDDEDEDDEDEDD